MQVKVVSGSGSSGEERLAYVNFQAPFIAKRCRKACLPRLQDVRSLSLSPPPATRPPQSAATLAPSRRHRGHTFPRLSSSAPLLLPRPTHSFHSLSSTPLKLFTPCHRASRFGHCDHSGLTHFQIPDVLVNLLGCHLGRLDRSHSGVTGLGLSDLSSGDEDQDWGGIGTGSSANGAALTLCIEAARPLSESGPGRGHSGPRRSLRGL